MVQPPPTCAMCVGEADVRLHMTEREIAAAGDDFKRRVRLAFAFLVKEFGFDPAVDESGEYSHRLVFRSASRDQSVTISNAFHPVDYGFEVSIDTISSPGGIDDRNIVYFKLKEEQEAGFPFLAEAAQALGALLRA